MRALGGHKPLRLLHDQPTKLGGTMAGGDALDGLLHEAIKKGNRTIKPQKGCRARPVVRLILARGLTQ